LGGNGWKFMRLSRFGKYKECAVIMPQKCEDFMGQRLNVEIKENGKVLANAYYHWSAYTSSSIGITQTILDSINKINYENRVANAVKLLEVTGSGLTPEEMEFAKTTMSDFDTYSFKPAIDRNDGLTAISVNGIEATECWEEHRVEIDLQTKTIKFGVKWEVSRKDLEEDYREDFDELRVCDFDFDEIPFDEFTKFNNGVEELIAQKNYHIRIKDKIFGFIE
jgi:hypothetical protein